MDEIQEEGSAKGGRGGKGVAWPSYHQKAKKTSIVVSANWGIV